MNELPSNVAVKLCAPTSRPLRDRLDPRGITRSTRSLAEAAMFLAALVSGCPTDVVQPFPFNHKAHVAGEVDCLQCHEGLLDRSASRLPTLETCVGCHSDPPPADKPELQKLAQLATQGAALEWDPALRLPDHVFFSHARHVVVAELECTKCHADMPERTSPPEHRRTFRMDDCIGCHQDHPSNAAAKRASDDCAACHR